MCVFQQKTSCDMLISDWSSDVCSSDLAEERAFSDSHEAMTREHRIKRRRIGMKRLPHVCYPIPMAIGSGANGQRRRRNSPAPQFCPKAGDQRSRTKDKAKADARKAEEFSK